MTDFISEHTKDSDGKSEAAAVESFQPSESLIIEAVIPIYVARSEPPALLAAVTDLQRDLRNVLGKDFPIVHDEADLDRRAAIVIAGPGADLKIGKERWTTGREAHRVFVHQGGNAPRSRGNAREPPRIVLQGADLRGAIYAVYSFSEYFLGVRPLWVWTSQPIERRESIEVPLGTDLHFPPPHVRWRGWFPNLQDCLGPWKQIPGNRELIAETLLRLRLNAWDTGSVLNETMTGLSADARVARDRGIVVLSTHTSPLGARIEERRWRHFWEEIQGISAPEISLANVEAMETFWKHAIQTVRSEDVEALWTITFRAHGDLGFWHGYDDAPESDSERADLISAMIERQVELVDRYAEETPVIHIPLYNEMSDYFLSGLLQLPRGPDVIWTLAAARRDHYPPDGLTDVAIPDGQPLGLYFNYQFASTGSHIAQGEGPWKMEANYRTIDDLGESPLIFSLVNTGGIREAVMELAASARMMWDFQDYSSDDFLMRFCAEYFGEPHAEDVARLYLAFFDSYWRQQEPAIAGFERQFIFHDLRYARMMREILPHLENKRHTREPIHLVAADFFCIVPKHSGAETTLDAVIAGTAGSIAKLEKVTARADELLPKIDVSGRIFFNDNLRVQAHFMLRINRSLHHLALALDCVDNNRQRQKHLSESLRAFRLAREILRETEHGRFETWYPRPGARCLFRFDAIESRLAKLL